MNSHSVTLPGHPGGTALSDSEKAEDLADSLKAQFRPVTASSVPAVIEMFNVQQESYFQTPASEPMLTDPDEVQNAIRRLTVGKLRAQTESPTGP